MSPKSTAKLPNKHGTFGERLRWLRERYALTLAEFGTQIGVGRSYLSKLENGKRQNVSAQFLRSVCEKFDVWDVWLESGQGEPFRYRHLNELAESGPVRQGREMLPHEKRAVFTDALITAGGYLEFGFSLKQLADALVQNLQNRQFDPSLRLEVARILALELAAQLSLNANKPDSLATAGIDEPVSELGNVAKEALYSLYEKAKLKSVQTGEGTGGPDALQKKDLTEPASRDILPDIVKPQLPSLLDRLNRATKETGKMSVLAKFLAKATGRKVPLASVSRWLSGKREPGGEITLLLRNWVERQERKE